jgi:hypothetical protein
LLIDKETVFGTISQISKLSKPCYEEQDEEEENTGKIGIRVGPFEQFNVSVPRLTSSHCDPPGCFSMNGLRSYNLS